VPVGDRRQMFFVHDKVAVYFGLAHENILKFFHLRGGLGEMVFL
jgi:hypothetical protein